MWQITPPQRGGVPLTAETIIGNSLCGEIVAPCGSDFPNANVSSKSYTQGEQITLQVILNEQHLNVTDPGNFLISYCTASNCGNDSNFQPFPSGKFADKTGTVPSILSFSVTLPSTYTGKMVVQVIYNVSAGMGPNYYICSDVTINTPSPAQSSDFFQKSLVLGYNGEVVIIAIAIAVVVIILIVVGIILIVKKARSGEKNDYGASISVNKEEGKDKAIPMMSMNQIQGQLMRTVGEPEEQGGYNQNQGYNQNRGYNQGGYNDGNN